MDNIKTRTELAKFVSDTVKDTLGGELADMIKENVAAAVEPLKATTTLAGAHPADGGKAVEDEKKGGFGTYVRALSAARNDKGRAAEIASAWGYKNVADAIQESTEKAMTSGDATAGGFLVPTQFANEVIELLRPGSSVRALGPETIPMPMGSFKIPRIVAGTSAAYVGESTNIQASQAQTGQISMSFKKLAALVPMSNDLVRYSSPQADTVVRNDVVRAMVAREDKAFIRDNGTDSTPKGLLNWVHSDNKNNANSTVNIANVTDDLGEMVRLLMAAEVPLVVGQARADVDASNVRPGWIMSPRTYKYLTTVRTTNGPYAFRDEMMTGTLWGWPFRVTSQVPENLGSGSDSELYLGGFAYALIGESLNMTVDASQDAAYADASGTIQATYSRDETVVRVISEHDFALRQDKGFTILQQVTWGS